LADPKPTGPEAAPTSDPAYEKLLEDIKGPAEPEPAPTPGEPAAEPESAVETPDQARAKLVKESREQLSKLRDPLKTTETEHEAIETYAQEKIDPKADEVAKARAKSDAAADKLDDATTKKEIATARGMRTKALKAEDQQVKEQDDLVIEQAAKLKAAAETSRALHEAKSEKDVDVAETMAHIENEGRDAQAAELDKIREDDKPRIKAWREETAAGHLASAQARSEVAGEELRKHNALIDKGVSELSVALEDLRMDPNTHALDGIGTNSKAGPEALTDVLNGFFGDGAIGVDLKNPFDQVITGGRFSKDRHDDFYYRSTKPEYKDIVFVVRYDHKSSTLQRMDTVKVPQKLEAGKDSLGWFADKKWRGELEDALVHARENDQALPTDGEKPFTPETPSAEALKANKKAKGKQGGAVLVDFGATEAAAAKHKPKRKGWWLSLFG